MIQTMENFLRSYVERQPASWSQHLALAEFAVNKAINVAIGHTVFFLNSGDQTCAKKKMAKNGNGKGTGKERVLSFPIQGNSGTLFFPVYGRFS